MSALAFAVLPFAFVGTRTLLRRLRSREWKIADPADNPALDRSRVPRQRCEQCDSGKWAEIGGVRVCALCGSTWAAGG